MASLWVSWRGSPPVAADQKDLVVGGILNAVMNRLGREGDGLAVGRGSDLGDGQVAFCDGLRAGRQRRRILFPRRLLPSCRPSLAGGGSTATRGPAPAPLPASPAGRRDTARASGSHPSTRPSAPLAARGSAALGHRVVDRRAIRRPGKGMHVELLADRAAAPRRPQPESPRSGRPWRRSLSASPSSSAASPGSARSVTKAIHLPSGLHCGLLLAAGVGQRPQPRLRRPQPQVVPIDAVLPVRALGGNHRRRAVGRNARLADRGRIQILVEGDRSALRIAAKRRRAVGKQRQTELSKPVANA